MTVGVGLKVHRTTITVNVMSENVRHRVLEIQTRHVAVISE